MIRDDYSDFSVNLLADITNLEESQSNSCSNKATRNSMKLIAISKPHSQKRPITIRKTSVNAG
jgi:hypothetical protein